MLNHSKYIREHPELKHVWEINVNYFHFLHLGAERLLHLSKLREEQMHNCKTIKERANLKDESSNYALMSVLMFIIASEAFINRFYEHRTNVSEKKKSEIIRHESLRKKWIDAPYYAGSKKRFDIKDNLFVRFEELIEIRNQLVHAKGDVRLQKFANYTIKGPDIDIRGPNNQRLIDHEYIDDAFWTNTEIPRDPNSFKSIDALEAKRILDGMISKLRELVGPHKVNDWLLRQENISYVRERKEDDELLK
jgi:hypothetical protein